MGEGSSLDSDEDVTAFLDEHREFVEELPKRSPGAGEVRQALIADLTRSLEPLLRARREEYRRRQVWTAWRDLHEATRQGLPQRRFIYSQLEVAREQEAKAAEEARRLLDAGNAKELLKALNRLLEAAEGQLLLDAL